MKESPMTPREIHLQQQITELRGKEHQMSVDTELVQLLQEGLKKQRLMASDMQVELLSLKLGRKATDDERVRDWQIRMQAATDELASAKSKTRPQIVRTRLAA